MSKPYFFAPSTLQIEENVKHASFTLVPLSGDAPFIQGMFDPSSRSLVLLSPHHRQHFDMMTQFDQKGLPKMFKGPDDRMTYAKKLTEFRHNHEVTISNPEAIVAFVSEVSDLSAENFGYLSSVVNGSDEIKPSIVLDSDNQSPEVKPARKTKSVKDLKKV
jgi:hypothetical protein